MPQKKKEGPASDVAYKLELPGIRRMADRRKGFQYTSPSVLPKRGKADKRERGCIEKMRTVKKKDGTEEQQLDFTGDYCSEWKNPNEPDKRKRVCKKGKNIPDPYCKGDTSPCSARASCPVQLIFLRGKPHLRFCQTTGERGYAIPISSPEEGQARAKEACENWKRLKTWKAKDPKTGKERKYYEEPPPKFFERNAPKIVEDAKRALPETGGLAGPPSLPILILPALIMAPLFLVAWVRR